MSHCEAENDKLSPSEMEIASLKEQSSTVDMPSHSRLIVKKRYPERLVIFITLLCTLAMSAAARTVDGDGILGVWLTEGKEAQVEIFSCGDKYCGKIIWMDEPNYTAEDKEGKPGERKLDLLNPDPALRHQTILGIKFMRNFAYAGDNNWTDGRVYDPESGHTYKATMSLGTPNQLHLRGYIIIPLFGRTSTWTRVK
jgi:uncharacterized protein (DUF2147 family)